MLLSVEIDMEFRQTFRYLVDVYVKPRRDVLRR